MRIFLLPPIVVLMCVGLMLLLDARWPWIDFSSTSLAWTGAVLIGAGLMIANWHARLFRRIGTNINTFGEPGQLTTAGLFGRTRNPMYLGMVMALAGVALMLGSLSALAVAAGFLGLAHFWYIPIEERAMARKFGDDYLRYRRAVRRWL